MASKEIYRIGIQVGVDGVEESKQKLSAMEKYTQQTEKRLKMLSKITANPTAKLVDQTSSAIDKINVKSKSLSRALISPTAKINDQATSKLDRISTTIKRLENSNITATLRINDQTDSYLNKVQAKSDRFKDTTINPTARVSAQSQDFNKTKSALMDLDGEFRSADMSATKYFNNMQEHSHNAHGAVSNSLSNMTREMDHVGRSISEEGDKLMMGITLPIMAIGAAAGKAGMDFDAQMSRVKAISGATGEEIAKLQNQALELGKATAFSAKQASEGMENLASAGFTIDEIMSSMPGLLNLAASSGESLANSSEIAASTLRGFGLAADQAGHVADVLAKNASATNAAVGDTGEAMKYIAPVARSMGLGLEEVTAAIGLMSNAGVKGSQSGTTLRSALTRLASPSKEASDAMAAIGFNAFDSQGKMKSLSSIIDAYAHALKGKTEQQQQDLTATIFGQEAMSGMLVLMQGGASALDELTNSYKNADGAAEEMAKTMQDNSKSAVEQMMGSLETAAIKVEEAFAPMIINMANKVQDLANSFADLSPEQQMFYAQLLGAAAVIGPVLKFIGGLTGSISKLISVGSKLGPLLGVTTASSAGIALGAVAALGVGIAGVQTHNELMAKSFDTSTDDLSTWEKMINVLTGSTIKSKKELQAAGLVYEDFSDSLSDNFKNSVEDASKAYNKLRMTLAFDSRNGVDFSDSMSSDIKSQVSDIVKSAKDAVMNKRGEMQSTLSQLFNLDDSTIDENENKVMENIAAYQDSKFDTIQTLNDNIYNTLNKAVDEHRKLTEEDINNIKNWTQQIQALQIESSTTNESDMKYASNQGKFEKRLGSMTTDEALSSMKDSYNQIIDINQDTEDKQRDIISKAQALEPELTNAYAKALENGETEKAEALKSSIETIEKKVTEAQDKLNSSVKERQEKTKDLWEAFYKANPNMQGHINEINFSKFSPADEKANSKFQEIMKWYPQIADVTETSMKRIQNADNTWSDIAITVDEATGKIVSIYDTTKGTVAGYSEQFVKDAENTYSSMFNAQAKIKALMNDNGKIGLDIDNNLVSIDGSGAETVIEKMQKVIELADGYRLAIANVNGTQIKMEFDKDGVLQNYEDVLSAINGDKSSKAIVNIDVNDKDALESLKNVSSAADAIPPGADIHISTNANEATSEVSETKNEIDSMKDKTVTITTIFKKITQWFEDKFSGSGSQVSDTAMDYGAQDGSRFVTEHASGTNFSREGFSTVDERGWELSDNKSVPILGKYNGNPLTYMSRGTKILNHMKSVDDMKEEVSRQVDSVLKIGYATGTDNAIQGIHPVAEKGFEIVFGRQNRLFQGGEKVLTHEKSKEFLKNVQNNEIIKSNQDQYKSTNLNSNAINNSNSNVKNEVLSKNISLRSIANVISNKANAITEVNSNMLNNSIKDIASKTFVNNKSNTVNFENISNVNKKYIRDGYAVGTNNATAGVHPVAERGFEIVFGRQNRLFQGGEKVLTHEKSKEFLKNVQNNEINKSKQDQYKITNLNSNAINNSNSNVKNEVLSKNISLRSIANVISNKANAITEVNSNMLNNSIKDIASKTFVNNKSNTVNFENISNVNKKYIRDGYAVGTNNSTTGVHPVAERGFEIVFGRQNRLFQGGEEVLHEQSKVFSQKQQNNEPFQLRQSQPNQYQLVKPVQQIQLAGVGGNNIQVSVNVVANHDVDAIIEQTTQEVGRKLKEALTTIKK